MAIICFFPTSKNPITKIFIDPELGNEAITYLLKDGTEDSVHGDGFLDFNCDPDYVRNLELHNITCKALDVLKEKPISKRELARRMKTSMSQLSRLLDTTNYTKTMDQMFKLFTVLGLEMRWEIKEKQAA